MNGGKRSLTKQKDLGHKMMHIMQAGEMPDAVLRYVLLCEYHTWATLCTIIYVLSCKVNIHFMIDDLLIGMLL